MDANRDAMDRAFDAMNTRFDRFYYLLFTVLLAFAGGLLGLLAKMLGVF